MRSLYCEKKLFLFKENEYNWLQVPNNAQQGKGKKICLTL